MAETLFLTGFPGFLGTDLLRRLLRDRPRARVRCLVLPRHEELARERLEDGVAPGGDGDRVVLHRGDVRRPGLGLERGERRSLAREIDEVFHLAAAYDLEVGEERATRVNVDGTRHVLDLAADRGELERFHHMSTCYVSGDHAGPFREEDLQVGQSFHNAYERSKAEAELAVRERMEEGLTATIYRPSIVVGDSDTGYTQKYDGPYHVVRWILRQPGVAVVPVPPGADESTVNLVPRDYVTGAVARLSRHPEAPGETVHLADPEPPTVRRLLRTLARAAGRRELAVPVPPSVLERALEAVPGLRAFTGIPPALVDYFDHPARYVCERAERLLAGSGLRPPPFADYAATMVAFVRAHPRPPEGPLL